MNDNFQNENRTPPAEIQKNSPVKNDTGYLWTIVIGAVFALFIVGVAFVNTSGNLNDIFAERAQAMVVVPLVLFLIATLLVAVSKKARGKSANQLIGIAIGMYTILGLLFVFELVASSSKSILKNF